MTSFKPEIHNDELFFKIIELVAERKPQTIIEIGSANGLGSTQAFLKGMEKGAYEAELFCLEVCEERFEELLLNVGARENIHCFRRSSVPLEHFMSEQDTCDAVKNLGDRYPKDTALHWRNCNMALIEKNNLPQDGIQHIKKEYGIDTFDMVLIDGSVFSSRRELDELWGSRIVVLDDTADMKNFENYSRLNSSDEYRILAENQSLRNGYAIYESLLHPRS